MISFLKSVHRKPRNCHRQECRFQQTQKFCSLQKSHWKQYFSNLLSKLMFFVLEWSFQNKQTFSKVHNSTKQNWYMLLQLNYLILQLIYRLLQLIHTLLKIKLYVLHRECFGPGGGQPAGDMWIILFVLHRECFKLGMILMQEWSRQGLWWCFEESMPGGKFHWKWIDCVRNQVGVFRDILKSKKEWAGLR